MGMEAQLAHDTLYIKLFLIAILVIAAAHIESPEDQASYGATCWTAHRAQCWQHPYDLVIDFLNIDVFMIFNIDSFIKYSYHFLA